MFRKTELALFLITTLIVASCNSLGLAQKKTPTWEKVFTEPVVDNFQIFWAVEPFEDHLYTAVADETAGMTLYRSANGKDWEAASQPGFGIDKSLWVSWDMGVFKDKLYVGVHNFLSNPVLGRVMRSQDGLNWETAFLMDEATSPNIMPASFGVFKDMLYVSVYTAYTCEMWRSPSGDQGTWERVLSVPGASFGAPLTVFKDYAYIAGGVDSINKVWRSSDGANWEMVGEGVVDDPANQEGETLAVFKDQLYLSTITKGGGRIYRSKDGGNWEMVITDGFGDPTFLELGGLIAYQGDLYVSGTAYEGEEYPPQNSSIRIFHSRTGNTDDWVQIPTDNWGAISSSERMQQAVYKDELYIINWNFYDTSDLYKLVYR